MQTNSSDRLLAAVIQRAERPNRDDQSRRKILARAVEIASMEGLEGLTIGRLANDLSISKSGLFSHFGSKEELQRQTIDFAIDKFFSVVIRPVLEIPRGAPRLAVMIEKWIEYVERGVFPGGCFFAAASLEFDGRPGPIRERIAASTNWWFTSIQDEIEMARELGHLPADTDCRQLAFELHAVVQEANWGYQMFGNAEWFERARVSVRRSLERAQIGELAAR